MKAEVRAQGYTNVIMILNMKRFIAEKDRDRYENIRGTQPFAEFLRNGCQNFVQPSPPFESMADERRRIHPEDGMSTEQIGFATGVFRSLFVEEHAVPTYFLKKQDVCFPPDLEKNFQFRKIFKKAWDNWKIYIRLTVTGMLVIRLTREYSSPRELIKIAEDVLNLQESLDIQSARDWLAKLEVKHKDQPDELNRAKKSIIAFFEWMGGNPSDKSELLYYPAQWKIAMVAAKLFVQAIGEIRIPMSEPIHLIEPVPQLSIPLHDSYVIFHLDELYADETIVVKKNTPILTVAEPVISNDSNAKRPARQIVVQPEAIRCSPVIRRSLLNLLEGAILEHEFIDAQMKKAHRQYFPSLRNEEIDHILDNNLSS